MKVKEAVQNLRIEKNHDKIGNLSMLYSSFNLVKFWLQPLCNRELDKKIDGYVLL